VKLEMEGREPLYLFFGLPICTTAIVLASLILAWLLQPRTPDVHVDVKPLLKADFTGAALPVKLTAEPARVTVQEVPTPAPFEVKVQAAPAPNVTVTLPERLALNVTGAALLGGVQRVEATVKAAEVVRPTPAEQEAERDTKQFGHPLPPPKEPVKKL
jgi:hypothetical protein